MRYQYVQNKVGALKVKIMPSSTYSESDTKVISKLIGERVGHDFEIDFEIVKEIPLTSRGKFKRLIREIDES